MSEYKLKICSIANKEHKKSIRQYAHVGCRKDTICVAKEYYKLPGRIQLGILYHELGHIAGAHGEAEADRLAERIYGVRISRIDTVYGDHLEYIP